MGNSAQLNGIGVQNASAVGKAAAAIKDIASALSSIADVVGIIGFVLQAFEPGEQAILNAIQNAFNQLNEHQKAADITARLTNLDNQIAPAQAVLENLQPALQGNLTDGDKLEMIQTCITAINALSQNVWFAPWQDQVYWCDWPDLTAPRSAKDSDLQIYTYCKTPGDSVAVAPDANGSVFSYTYVLPAYLRVLAIFTTVGGALDPNFMTNYGQTVLAPAASLLSQWHDKILNEGITELVPVTWLWWLSHPNLDMELPRPQPWSPFPPPAPWTGALLFAEDLSWTIGPVAKQLRMTGVAPYVSDGTARATIEYGAIEKFSGLSAMGRYEVQLRPLGDPSWLSTTSADPFAYQKFQVRVSWKAKSLYVGVGLSQLRATINILHSLLGTPPLTGLSFADWSFRQVGNMLGGLRSLKQMKSFLESTPPADTPPESPLSPVGFRALLEV